MRVRMHNAQQTAEKRNHYALWKRKKRETGQGERENDCTSEWLNTNEQKPEISPPGSCSRRQQNLRALTNLDSHRASRVTGCASPALHIPLC